MIEVALQVLTLTEDAALLTSNGIISAAEIMEKIDAVNVPNDKVK